MFLEVFKNIRITLKSSNEKLPVYSIIALFYPISAGVYANLSGLRLDLAFYYGLSNLGYLLLAAGVVKGTFKSLGLKTRSEVFIYGIIALATGIIFTYLTVN